MSVKKLKGYFVAFKLQSINESILKSQCKTGKMKTQILAIQIMADELLRFQSHASRNVQHAVLQKK